MKKKGFFLIECSVALLILMMVASVYAWYLGQSIANQTIMTLRLARVTSMSNYIEWLYASGAHDTSDIHAEDANDLVVQSLSTLPLITGPWSSLCSAESKTYRLLQIQRTIRNEVGKEEQCTWYVGLIDHR